MQTANVMCRSVWVVRNTLIRRELYILTALRSGTEFETCQDVRTLLIDSEGFRMSEGLGWMPEVVHQHPPSPSTDRRWLVKRSVGRLSM